MGVLLPKGVLTSAAHWAPSQVGAWKWEAVLTLLFLGPLLLYYLLLAGVLMES